MKRIPLSLFTFLFLLSGLCAAPTKTVWQIGRKIIVPVSWHCPLTNTKSFWQMILVGRTGFISLDCLPLKKIFLMFCRDLPIIGEEQVILPVYGLMFKHTLWYEGSSRNGLMEINHRPIRYSPRIPALFKITINGKSWKYALPKGSGKSIDGELFTNQTAYDRNSSELRSDQKRKQLHRAYKSRRLMDSLR